MTSTQDIAKTLRAEILAGAIAPGQELRQEELAARFHVSRMPIRDALNMLSCDRLITLRPNRGGRVVVLTEAELEEVFELRIVLEVDVLQRALKNIDDQSLAHIKREMRRCELEAGSYSFPEADWRFHCALYTPANRNRQIDIIRQLRDVCQLHQAAYYELRKSEKMWSVDHEKIVEAIELGNTKLAASALAAHIKEAGYQLKLVLANRSDT